MLPSAFRVHLWLFWPLQSQMITAVPSAVPAPFTSRHLPPYTRSSPELVAVHCWLVPPWQSQMCTWAPLDWEAPSTSRHRFDPTPLRAPVSSPGDWPPGPAAVITAWAAAGQAPLATVTLLFTTLPRSPLVTLVLPLVDQLPVTVKSPMFSPYQ